MAGKIRSATKAVIFREGKVLLIAKSSSEDVNPSSWDIPGGGIEPGEDVEVALRREVREETGLDIEILGQSRTWSFTQDSLRLEGTTFCCLATHGEVRLSEEHTHFKWLSPAEIHNQELPGWIKEEVTAAKRLLLS